MKSSSIPTTPIPVGQQVIMMQLETLQGRRLLQGQEVRAVKKRIGHLSEPSLEILGQLLHDTPPDQVRHILPVFTDWPETAILALDGKLKLFVAHAHVLMKLQSEIARAEVSPNASPMVRPLLRDAMEFPDGLDHLAKLNMIGQWVDAYRFHADGALTILEEAHSQTMQDSTLNLLSERLNQIPEQKLARPFKLRDLAAVDDEAIKHLMASQKPELMQALAYDYNRWDYDDVIEKQIAEERAVPYQQPTPMGERIIHQISTARENNRQTLLQQTRALMEPFIPRETHGYLYSRLDSMAPTAESAKRLHQFIKRTLWSDPTQLHYYPPTIEGQLHVANPSASHVQGLVQMLEDMPISWLKTMMVPNEQSTYVPGVKAMGETIRAYTPADEEFAEAYSVWEKDFKQQHTCYTDRADIRAFHKLYGWLQDNGREQLIYSQPTHMRLLLDAQEALYANRTTMHAMELLKAKLKTARDNLSDKSLRMLKLPSQLTIDDAHLLELPEEKFKAALQAICIDQLSDQDSHKVMLETLGAIAGLERPSPSWSK